MESYRELIYWLQSFESGQQLQSLLEVLIPNGEEIGFLISERENPKPLLFLVSNATLIIDGKIDLFSEIPNIFFTTIRNKEDIVQKKCRLMTQTENWATTMKRFKDIVLELTFKDGSVLTLNNFYEKNAETLVESVFFMEA